MNFPACAHIQPFQNFQNFQHDFARRCRDPRAPRPPGVPAERMAIYQELLFNNVTGFLDACLPICRELLGERRWRLLQRAFYRDWPSRTPWFRDIPREFVAYLAASRQRLPRWLPDLAHYEWIELAVDTSDATVPAHDAAGDLLDGCPQLNPTLHNLAYDWPVHRIGAAYRPRKPQAVRLLVFRDATDAVRFAEINPVTARLLAVLDEEQGSGRSACLRVAAELNHSSPPAVVAHGAALLDALHRLGAILGTRP